MRLRVGRERHRPREGRRGRVDLRTYGSEGGLPSPCDLPAPDPDTTRVFVATAAGQGAYDGDRFDCLEGEPVIWPQTCDTPDSHGCRYEVVGLGSGGPSTTFTVADIDIDRSTYLDMLADMFRRMGFTDIDDELRELMGHWLDDAAEFTPGDVLVWWDDTPTPQARLYADHEDET